MRVMLPVLAQTTAGFQRSRAHAGTPIADGSRFFVAIPAGWMTGRNGRRSEIDGSVDMSEPRWSRGGSAVAYPPAEVWALTPVRESVEKRALLPDLRDVFLCHAWDDRRGPAKELHDLLELLGV